TAHRTKSRAGRELNTAGILPQWTGIEKREDAPDVNRNAYNSKDLKKSQDECALEPEGFGMGMGDPSAPNTSPVGFGIGMGEPPAHCRQLRPSPTDTPTELPLTAVYTGTTMDAPSRASPSTTRE